MLSTVRVTVNTDIVYSVCVCVCDAVNTDVVYSVTVNTDAVYRVRDSVNTGVVHSVYDSVNTDAVLSVCVCVTLLTPMLCIVFLTIDELASLVVKYLLCLYIVYIVLSSYLLMVT